MENHDEYSPFMSEFLKQIDALSAAFRNLPAEDYEAALVHVNNLMLSFSGSCNSVSGPSNIDEEVNNQQSLNSPFNQNSNEDGFHRHAEKNSPEDSNSDSLVNHVDRLGIPERGSRRRKKANPKRSSELYDVCSDDLAEETSNGNKRNKKLPKADVVGCQVVTDFKGDERFQCDQCELKFSYYAALLRHLDSRHKTFDANQKIQEVNKKAVSCDQCGATLSSKGALHAHMQMHAGVQPYHCDVCSKNFSLKSNLLRHKRIHEGLKPYKCDICHKRFTEKRSVEVHRRIHTGERPYSCDVCGMKFSQLGSWMGHRDTHKGKEQTKYDCTACGKRFSQKVGLHNHRKRHHDNNKGHKCLQCEAAFYSPEELRLHTMSHSGDKPYLCSECGKSFSRQQTFKNHMKQHNSFSCRLVGCHMQTHFGKRKLLAKTYVTCFRSLAGKLCKSLMCATQHLRSPNGDKAAEAAQKDEALYICPMCPLRFTSTWALSRHKKSHRDSLIDNVVGNEVGLVEDVLGNEELSVLPKDVLAVYCSDGTIGPSSSHDLLEAISKGQMF